MTLAELRKQLEKESASRPLVPPPPLPEMTPEWKQAAQELMQSQIRHDAEVRYGPFVRQHENDDSVSELRLLEIQAALFWRE